MASLPHWEDLQRWGVDDVVRWLKSAKLHECEKTFRSRVIDGRRLCELMEIDVMCLPGIDRIKKRQIWGYIQKIEKKVTRGRDIGLDIRSDRFQPELQFEPSTPDSDDGWASDEFDTHDNENEYEAGWDCDNSHLQKMLKRLSQEVPLTESHNTHERTLNKPLPPPPNGDGADDEDIYQNEELQLPEPVSNHSDEDYTDPNELFEDTPSPPVPSRYIGNRLNRQMDTPPLVPTSDRGGRQAVSHNEDAPPVPPRPHEVCNKLDNIPPALPPSRPPLRQPPVWGKTKLPDEKPRLLVKPLVAKLHDELSNRFAAKAKAEKHHPIKKDSSSSDEDDYLNPGPCVVPDNEDEEVYENPDDNTHVQVEVKTSYVSEPRNRTDRPNQVKPPIPSPENKGKPRSASAPSIQSPPKLKGRPPLPLPITPKPVPPPTVDPEQAQLQTYPWYYESLRRTDAESLLMQIPSDGNFLVRKSENHPCTLVLMYGGRVCNIPIRKRADNHMYALGKLKEGEQTFSRVPDLVNFHKKFMLTTGGGQVSLKLCPADAGI
ncbi:lymphocyte cytosolic protein 2-like isoform X6 [Tubulanus polymorphus]|uniref:lymphocyte cytosolic protein 2-like isoform X6 n=1 Tax=Tubulanus polymorphus TaxID=672921 RepID=UPI003DA547AF